MRYLTVMEDNFKKFVDALSITPSSIDVIQKITLLIEEQTFELFSLFFSQSIESLFTLENWAWQQLNYDYYKWINQPDYLTLFHTLASFNKKLIFNHDDIENETKASLLIPDTIDQIDGIFEQINQSNDDNDPFIAIVCLWLDNLSFFIHENPHFNASPVICYINQCIGRNYLMTDEFKFYLTQLQQSRIPQSIFSAKQLFYIKTCSFSLNSYLCASGENFPFATEELLHHIGTDYLQIINIHGHMIESWNKELLTCITHLTGFVHSCCWRNGENLTTTKIFLSTEQITCDFSQALIRILRYKPFYKEIKSKQSNSETFLIYVILKLILFILYTQNMNWFFGSNLLLPDTILIIAENSTFDEICLCAYAILGEILTDEKLKALKVSNTIADFFYHVLKQCCGHPLKKYKHTPIAQLLRGFSNLTKSDAIQQRMADSPDGLLLLVEMCDEYPIIFDILWALSFNHDIQQQLRSNALFMSKLGHLEKECDTEQMRKIIHGLLWNLEINHQDRPTSENVDNTSFDIMISYSHKDKILCRQIYDELIKSGYHIWIDFDQMHGNVMDAMAQAIEQSQTVIICMSEQYRRSNYCRAEAHYAFQRQRKIVPVLLQKHYKPDGWLLFLIGQLVYIDFTKYEFPRAITMLFQELKVSDIVEINQAPVRGEENTDSVVSIQLASTTKPSSSLVFSQNILEWTSMDVQAWLIDHNLGQMARLLANCNGRSLVYLNKYMKTGESQQILKLLQTDSLRRTGEDLSLIELSCFQYLMHEQKRIVKSSTSTRTKTDNDKNAYGRVTEM